MTTSRYLAPAALVAALLAGCSQSLFSDGGGNGPDGSQGTPDGSIPSLPDGSIPSPPDGGGPDEQDGGVDSPDAAMGPRCEDSCVGDAYADFSGEQGGINSRWRYVEVQASGEYVDMVYTQLPDSSSGWQGTDTGPPTIVSCNVGAGEPPCLELGGLLALTSNAPDRHHPALMWTAPQAGYYLVTGSWRGSSTAPTVETLMRITQNNETVAIASQQFPLTATARVINSEAVLLEGDSLVLSVRPVTDGSVTVGVELFVSGPY